MDSKQKEPPSARATALRKIAKDAAENIYNDETVLHVQDVDGEDALERWIRIIEHALIAGGVMAEPAAPPALREAIERIHTHAVRCGYRYIQILAQDALAQFKDAAPPFGTCGYHSKGLRHQQTEYCREFTPEAQPEDAAPPQGTCLKGLHADGTFGYEPHSDRGGACDGWTPLPPAPQEVK